MITLDYKGAWDLACEQPGLVCIYRRATIHQTIDYVDIDYEYLVADDADSSWELVTAISPVETITQ